MPDLSLYCVPSTTDASMTASDALWPARRARALRGGAALNIVWLSRNHPCTCSLFLLLNRPGA
eukprot:251863-Chlamydomonas_euryale.AAC.10